MRTLVLSSLFLSACSLAVIRPPLPVSEAVVERVAFGSCLLQGQPQPIWKAIADADPDVFIFAGDNIYADTYDVSIIESKYRQLGSEPGYQTLRSQLLAKGPGRLLATWDDHDYGENDAYRTYPKKRESQQLFLDFFEEPANSSRRKHDGIYDAVMFGPPGSRLQVILLDTRYFRDAFDPSEEALKAGRKSGGPYAPTSDTKRTMLGKEQWAWLERQFKQPADLRLLVSSIPVVPDEYTSEIWAMMPHERDRILRSVAASGNTIILSGDRHYAELSRMDYIHSGRTVSIYDFTSSGMNRIWEGGAKQTNRWRIEAAHAVHNFGMLYIEYRENPVVILEALDESGKTLISHRIRLADLKQR
jgi:alkaline phosphatase D